MKIDAFAKALAMMDYRNGLGLTDNPYAVGTVGHVTWRAEMEALLNQDDERDLQISQNNAEAVC